MITIPTYLSNNVKDCKQGGHMHYTICSSKGNELLEVWYYGDLKKISSETYIVDTNNKPTKVVAKCPETGEEILIYDGAKHGYDNMFCNEYTLEQVESRPLKRYDILPSKLTLTLGYSIDYEEEKEDYNVDENGDVLLIDNSKLSWEAVKCNGYDYISLSYTHGKKQTPILDFELA